MLAHQRDTLLREPELDKLAELLGTAFDLPNDDRMEAIASGVHQKLAEYDRRYRPESLPKSVPSVAFSQLEQPVAVWLDGKVRKVAPKPRPSGLLTVARLIAESQKNKQEG
jgi:hypothetical protein